VFREGTRALFQAPSSDRPRLWLFLFLKGRPMCKRADKGDPGQLLDILRDVLLEHMNHPEAIPDYQVQSAVYIGRSGRLVSDEHIANAWDIPCGLRLTMRSGHEYDLKLDFAEGVSHD
jgi:hypothetical protein